MFAASHVSKRFGRPGRMLLAASVGVFLTVGSLDDAWAGLGQAGPSVRADRARLSAAMTSQAAGAYVVHTLTLPNGGVVHEYEAGGVVFAVSWRAPGRPDLRQLLGDHFATLQAQTARTAGPRTRTPLRVDGADLIVRSGGHPGAFHGLAYLPRQAPAGVTSQDLR